MKAMTASDARARLPEILDHVAGSPKETVEIMRHGEPVATIMSVRLYHSIVETLEILSDENTAKVLREALRDMKKAKFIPLDQIRDELNIEL
jgi:prevent-host-death family protein